MTKILKVINIIFIWIILSAFILGLWFWHEADMAKVHHQMIEDALMGISFDSSES